MQNHRIFLGFIAIATCLTMIACGDSQKRQKITDRTGARDSIKNSKLLKPANIIQECASESGKENEAKDILSLEGLRDSLTTADASNLFASSFTNRMRITDGNNRDLKEAKLSQKFLLDNGLQYRHGTLDNITPSLLPVSFENCEHVEIRVSVTGQEPNMLLQLARFTPFEISQLVTVSDLAAAEDGEVTNEEPEAGNHLKFYIDRDASSEDMLVLDLEKSDKRIIFKVLNEETIQIITTEPRQYSACGKSYSFELRNEATVVWGKKLQEPVSIDRELYNTMKAVSNKPELLDSGVQQGSSLGRRNNSGSSQSVTLPVGFIGSFDESIALAKKNPPEPNDFDIQPVVCDDDSEERGEAPADPVEPEEELEEEEVEAPALPNEPVEA